MSEPTYPMTVFDIEDREYRAVAVYPEVKGDACVKIYHRDELIREFDFPGYQVWIIAAHFSDIVDSEIEKDDHGYRLAAWNGIGPL